MSISKSMPVVCLVGFSLLGPGLCRGQDSHTPDVSAQTNTASSAPLTDRERMLLDRIDKLEQRLTVLEGKPSSGNPSTSQAVPSPQQPSTPIRDRNKSGIPSRSSSYGSRECWQQRQCVFFCRRHDPQFRLGRLLRIQLQPSGRASEPTTGERSVVQ